MKNAVIKYRRFWPLPFSKTINTSIPEKWQELTASQLIAVTDLFNQRISEVKFLSEMTGVPLKIAKKTTPFERYQLMEYFEFLKEPKACSVFFIDHLYIRNFDLCTFGHILIAPLPKLKGMTFGQFIFAETYYKLFQESSADDNLNKFIASLYLPRKTVFSEEIIAENARLVQKVPLNVRQAIALNWVLINEWLTLSYPLIFQKRQQLDEAPASEPSPIDTNVWIRIFQNLVGDDILHDDQWAAKPVNTIFAYMTQKCKENARKH